MRWYNNIKKIQIYKIINISCPSTSQKLAADGSLWRPN
jgi:hypothetical protein